MTRFDVQSQVFAGPRPRTIRALVMPWGKVGQHSNGNRWRFARGALRFVHEKYVRINHNHSARLLFGNGIESEDTDEGLVMTFAVRPGPHGDRMLDLAQRNVKVGFSVEVDIDSADMGPDPEDPTIAAVSMAI